MTPAFFIRRPVFAWVIALGILLGGVLALRSLPVEQYPSIAPPALRITALRALEFSTHPADADAEASAAAPEAAAALFADATRALRSARSKKSARLWSNRYLILGT